MSTTTDQQPSSAETPSTTSGRDEPTSGRDGPPQHRHAAHEEGFYVVSGSARFTVGETTYAAAAGAFVMVPAGVPHTFATPSDQPTVLWSAHLVVLSASGAIRGLLSDHD